MTYLSITQKEIKRMIRSGEATELVRKYQIAQGYDVIAVSSGIYGINGALIRSKSGKLYGIPERNSMLFAYV